MIHSCRIRSRAFTLLELLITITVIAVVASVVTPMLSDDHRLRVMAASEILRSDIELAQVMTISFPQQPVVVHFDTVQKNSYWLAYASDPETPLLRADTADPYSVVFGVGRATGASGVLFDVPAIPNGILEFDTQGGLVDFTSAPSIVLQSGRDTITLNIAPTTGTVTEAEAEVVSNPVADPVPVGGSEALEGAVQAPF